MTLSLMTPDEILSLKLDKENTRGMLITNELFGAFSNAMPFIGHAFQIFLLFYQYGQHYTQMFCRVCVFAEVFFRAIPLTLAHSASSNAYFQFGQQFSNISQIQVSHYLLVCLLYQALAWVVFCFSALVDCFDARRFGDSYVFTAESFSLIRAVSKSLLRVEENDIAFVAPWLLIKIVSEPAIQAFTRGSQIFMIAEGKADYAIGVSLYQATIETISVFFAFIQAAKSEPGAIFRLLAIAQLFSGICFSAIYIAILTFQSHKFIFFQLSKKYIFPVNWATIRRICSTAMPMLAQHAGLYIVTLLCLAFYRFYSAAHADMQLTNLLFQICVFDIYQGMVQGAITALETHHAYYYGRQKYVKARTAVNTTLFVLFALATIVVVIFLVARVTIYDFFTMGTEFNHVSDLLTQRMHYMVYFYISTYFFIFGCLARYVCQYRSAALLLSVTLLSLVPIIIVFARQLYYYPYSTDFTVVYHFIIIILCFPCVIVFVFYTIRDFHLIQKYGDYDKYTPFKNN